MMDYFKFIMWENLILLDIKGIYLRFEVNGLLYWRFWLVLVSINIDIYDEYING